jgi:hypothetical protein
MANEEHEGYEGQLNHLGSFVDDIRANSRKLTKGHFDAWGAALDQHLREKGSLDDAIPSNTIKSLGITGDGTFRELQQSLLRGSLLKIDRYATGFVTEKDDYTQYGDIFNTLTQSSLEFMSRGRDNTDASGNFGSYSEDFIDNLKRTVRQATTSLKTRQLNATYNEEYSAPGGVFSRITEKYALDRRVTENEVAFDLWAGPVGKTQLTRKNFVETVSEGWANSGSKRMLGIYSPDGTLGSGLGMLSERQKPGYQQVGIGAEDVPFLNKIYDSETDWLQNKKPGFCVAPSGGNMAWSITAERLGIVLL